MSAPLKAMPVVVLMLLAVTAIAKHETVESQPLGPSGSIPAWLMLANIPIPGDKDTWATTMEQDLLAPAGGEVAVKPVGGQSVTLPSGTYTWALTPTRTPPARRPGWGPVSRVPLFVDDELQPLENRTAYLYAVIVSDREQAADLLLGSDDSVKILLNGREIHRFVGQRSPLVDSEMVSLPLQKGANRLLVRVDNYISSGGFVGRLIAPDGADLDGVHVELPGADKAPLRPLPDRPAPAWEDVVSEIPPVPPAMHQEFFGSRLTRTMSLLEDGRQTGRPVRIVFYGQSITDQEWTNLLVERLRERYPGARIESENHALGGWFVWRLMRAMVHGTLQSRPDLVVFHAYQGRPENWERVLSAVRRETCADIMIRSRHVARREWPAKAPGDDYEVTMLRRLAQKYNCELVEGRAEWLNYLHTHNMEAMNLLRDGIHLNRRGNVLMAQLYERHFVRHFTSPSWWADRVRWVEALHPLRDLADDEIRLSGDAWTRGTHGTHEWAEIDSADGALTLDFTGRRADVVLGPRPGGMRVLIDGQPPSAHNLYYGTLPTTKVNTMGGLQIMRYFTGPDMQEEVWEMRFTHMGGADKRFRYELHGSKTGFDGIGNSEENFVSNSGRIRILLEDMNRQPVPPEETAAMEPPPPLTHPKIMTWRILPRFRDTIHWDPPADEKGEQPTWNYITIADGLPDGPHTLTLIPLGDGPVAVRGIQIYRPPLMAQ